MLFRKLSLQCPCGQPALAIKSVGLTDDHQLAIHWRCNMCRKLVYSVKPLTDCWKECPVDENTGIEIVDDYEDEHLSEDRRFLRSMGVNPDSQS